MLIEKNID